MTLSQIHNMDIVSQAGAVGSIVVVAEDMDHVKLSNRDTSHVGHQIVRDTGRILAYVAALMRADRVEIPKQHCVESRDGLYRVLQDILSHQLRVAVRTGGGARHGCRLVIGYGSVRTIDSSRRREDKILHVMLFHCVEQA